MAAACLSCSPTSWVRRAPQALGKLAKEAEEGLAEARRFFGVKPSHLKDGELLPFFTALLDAVKKGMPPPEKVKKPKLPPLPPPGTKNAFNPAAAAEEAANRAKARASRAAERAAAEELAAATSTKARVGSEPPAPVEDPMAALIAAIHSQSKAKVGRDVPAPAGAPAAARAPAASDASASGVPSAERSPMRNSMVTNAKAGLRPVQSRAPATRLDPSLFGRSNAEVAAERGLDGSAPPTARQLILARIKEQESRQAGEIRKVHSGKGASRRYSTAAMSGKVVSSKVNVSGKVESGKVGSSKNSAVTDARAPPAAAAAGAPDGGIGGFLGSLFGGKNRRRSSVAVGLQTATIVEDSRAPVPERRASVPTTLMSTAL
jgi:hypothetical protein